MIVELKKIVYSKRVRVVLERFEPTFPLMEKQSKDQGLTGFTAAVKDYAVASELATLKQQMLLTLRLPPSRTFTRLGLDKEALLPLGIADTGC